MRARTNRTIYSYKMKALNLSSSLVPVAHSRSRHECHAQIELKYLIDHFLTESS